jgi:hypothetical protein
MKEYISSEMVRKDEKSKEIIKNQEQLRDVLEFIEKQEIQ